MEIDFSVCEVSIPFAMYVSTGIGGMHLHELILSCDCGVVDVVFVAMEFVLLLFVHIICIIGSVVESSR